MPSPPPPRRSPTSPPQFPSLTLGVLAGAGPAVPGLGFFDPVVVADVVAADVPAILGIDELTGALPLPLPLPLAPPATVEAVPEWGGSVSLFSPGAIFKSFPDGVDNDDDASGGDLVGALPFPFPPVAIASFPALFFNAPLPALFLLLLVLVLAAVVGVRVGGRRGVFGPGSGVGAALRRLRAFCGVSKSSASSPP